METTTPQAIPFTSYQKFTIFILAITQFTVILDFMVMSPLGDILMKTMQLKPTHFGLVVSAYAFSAGISGLLTAGFADKFDRKKLLLFFYIGFIIGTIFCGIVTSYPLLVAARIFTGLFGGVIGSISMAIVTDLFSMHQRGRVMGFIQMAFGASQIFGIPLGLYIATAWDWHAPFLGVAAMAIIIAILIALKLKPLTAHLSLQKQNSPLQHLLHTITKKEYRIGFSATAILSLGGFMLMPFGSAFAINNLKITEEELPLLFMIAGISTLIIMPVVGKLSDKIDKYKIFAAASIWTVIMVAVYTNLSETPFWIVAIINVLMMMGVMSRMVPSTALVSSIPAPQDRGAFMSINSSLQQISGGIAAAFAGTIVVQKDNFSPLEHYNTLGYIIIGISLLSIVLLGRVNQHLKKNPEQESETVLAVSEL